MKSIGARLTIWYALTATVSLACLFGVGYYLLEFRLVHGLDLLNAAEFKQLRAQLGTDMTALTSAEIERRIRKTTDYGSTLFYIDVHSAKIGTLFRSTNLKGATIPDIRGVNEYNVDIPDVGELRVREFILPPFDVAIGTPLAQVREAMRRYVQVAIGLIGVMMLISVALGFGLSRLVLKPIRAISETADRIGSDNLSERIPVSEVDDEIAALARLLNQTFDRLESSFKQIRRFTADASHELKTPLSMVRLHAEKMLIEGGLTSAHEEAVHVQLEEIARLNSIIEDLLFLSRADAQGVAIKFTRQDPEVFLKSFMHDVRVLVEHHDRRFSYSHDGLSEVAFEAKWLRQVLLNLLTNALRATPVQGLIELSSVVTNDLWRIRVDNEGSSLTEEQRERVFERFVRFNSPENEEKGSGLGLAICRSIVELHRGEIYAEAAHPGPGLSVVIEIPMGPG